MLFAPLVCLVTGAISLFQMTVGGEIYQSWREGHCRTYPDTPKMDLFLSVLLSVSLWVLSPILLAVSILTTWGDILSGGQDDERV